MSQKRYAYLIGANGPQDMRLKHAETDVIRLASALKGPFCGFASTEVVIAGSRQGGLRGFKPFAEQCTPGDLLLVHFSGHAIFDEQLYLLCNDSDINDLISTALEINAIKTHLRRSKASYKVLILDCCHAAGAHPGGALRGEQDVQTIIRSTIEGSGAAILSACSRRDSTRELDALDGGSGFLSWAIRAGCTTRFHDASSLPTLNVLSLDDLAYNWIPKALKEVNSTSCKEHPLPSPLFLSESELGYGGRIWLTDPPTPVREREVKGDQARRKYLEQVHKRYSSVTLPIGPAEGFSLHAIFQPLALRRDPLAAGDLERQQRRKLLGELAEEEDVPARLSSAEHKKEPPDETKRLLPVIAEHGEDALTKSPQGRVVVLGGPGTGKTTTLKHLISLRAKEAFSDPTIPVPIYLSLTDLARSGKTLQSYLIDIVEDMGVERSYADVLGKELESGHAFVALDSLDEVDPAQRPRMIELINSRASEPGNIWLVGSRFTEYKGGQFKHGQFAEWELLPMSAQLRHDLAARLFPELQRLLSPISKLPASPAAFVSLLGDHPHAAAWGKNPLLFSLAAVVFVKTGDLPLSRATLYHDVIEAVLTMREPDTVSRNHLLRVLTGLALWLHQSRGRTFTSEDLLTFLEDIGNKRVE